MVDFFCTRFDYVYQSFQRCWWRPRTTLRKNLVSEENASSENKKNAGGDEKGEKLKNFFVYGLFFSAR